MTNHEKIRKHLHRPSMSLGMCNTQYAIRNTQYAIRNTQYAIRNTQYAIRNKGLSPDTQYAIRNTQYAMRVLAPDTQYSIRNTHYAIRKPCQTVLRNTQKAASIRNGSIRCVWRTLHLSEAAWFCWASRVQNASRDGIGPPTKSEIEV
jgi:hypothetical protein